MLRDFPGPIMSQPWTLNPPQPRCGRWCTTLREKITKNTPISHLTINNKKITAPKDICNEIASTLARISSDQNLNPLFGSDANSIRNLCSPVGVCVYVCMCGHVFHSNRGRRTKEVFCPRFTIQWNNTVHGSTYNRRVYCVG